MNIWGLFPPVLESCNHFISSVAHCAIQQSIWIVVWRKTKWRCNLVSPSLLSHSLLQQLYDLCALRCCPSLWNWPNIMDDLSMGRPIQHHSFLWRINRDTNAIRQLRTYWCVNTSWSRITRRTKPMILRGTSSSCSSSDVSGSVDSGTEHLILEINVIGANYINDGIWMPCHKRSGQSMVFTSNPTFSFRLAKPYLLQWGGCSSSREPRSHHQSENHQIQWWLGMVRRSQWCTGYNSQVSTSHSRGQI